jgi:hypothetical protein
MLALQVFIFSHHAERVCDVVRIERYSVRSSGVVNAQDLIKFSASKMRTRLFFDEFNFNVQLLLGVAQITNCDLVFEKAYIVETLFAPAGAR